MGCSVRCNADADYDAAAAGGSGGGGSGDSIFRWLWYAPMKWQQADNNDDGKEEMEGWQNGDVGGGGGSDTMWYLSMNWMKDIHHMINFPIPLITQMQMIKISLQYIIASNCRFRN